MAGKITERKKCPNPVLRENVVVQGLYRLGIFSGPTSMYAAYCGPDTIRLRRIQDVTQAGVSLYGAHGLGQGTVGVQQ